MNRNPRGSPISHYNPQLRSRVSNVCCGDRRQCCQPGNAYQDENIWLTQKMMAALYDVSVQNVGQHIKKILDDGELSPVSVIKKYFITATDGKDYDTKHYNLQMIIAVGFKVNNERAVRFRKWAGQIVKYYKARNE